jgi:hypothetical protein
MPRSPGYFVARLLVGRSDSAAELTRKDEMRQITVKINSFRIEEDEEKEKE